MVPALKGLGRRLTAPPLSVVIHATPGWMEVWLWAWPADFDHLSSCLVVCADVGLVPAVEGQHLRTHRLVVGRNQLH